jgi:hypothetical protein
MIFGLFSRSEGKLARQQLEAFVGMLANCNPQDLGLTVALVEHFANAYVALGRDFYSPTHLIQTKPEMVPLAIGETQRLQASGLQVAASGWIVWGHTFRAINFPELMPHAKEMWRYLSGGFPYAFSQAATLEPLLGFVLLVERPDRFPKGFEPDDVV